MMRMGRVSLLLVIFFCIGNYNSLKAFVISRGPARRIISLSSCLKEAAPSDCTVIQSPPRRHFFKSVISLVATSSVTSLAVPQKAQAAEITDKIFIEVKSPTGQAQRIVIGLFGKDAPQATGQLKQLVSSGGLPALCKPIQQRTLAKQQLEANKVYNSCKENEDKGVNYEYGTVWRIVKDERIDVGAVSGKFVSREYPNWSDTNTLKHDSEGIVSVQKGDSSGFGFTIYPGKGDPSYLDENHVVVGKVLEGMDAVQRINETPVVASSKINYMGLTGGPSVKSAPSRGCFYGGPMYCNENKPLQKLSLTSFGVAN